MEPFILILVFLFLCLSHFDGTIDFYRYACFVIMFLFLLLHFSGAYVQLLFLSGSPVHCHSMLIIPYLCMHACHFPIFPSCNITY